VATYIEELDAAPAASRRIIESYGGHSLHEQSHGEAFISLFMNRFGGNGLYILDEPEAALSPSRQMVFLSRMHDLVCKNSQFIIATHSPIIMAYPNAMIYTIDESGLQQTDYEKTDHYIVYKKFMNDYRHVLKTLME
jgi:predicted ATPase